MATVVKLTCVAACRRAASEAPARPQWLRLVATSASAPSSASPTPAVAATASVLAPAPSAAAAPGKAPAVAPSASPPRPKAVSQTPSPSARPPPGKPSPNVGRSGILIPLGDRISMRTSLVLLAFTSLASLSSVFLCATPAALAQVSDAERAGARELFKEGDQLQRAGHFAEALDKFERAQQVFSRADEPPAHRRVRRGARAARRVRRDLPRGPARHPCPRARRPRSRRLSTRRRRSSRRWSRACPRSSSRCSPRACRAPRCRSTARTCPARSSASPCRSMRASTRSRSSRRVTRPPSSKSSSRSTRLEDRRSRAQSEPAGRRSCRARDSARTASARSCRRDAAPAPAHRGRRPRAGRASARQGRSPRRPAPRFRGGGGTVPAPYAGDAVDPTNVGSGGVAFGLDGGLRFARHWYVGLTLDRASLGSGNVNDLPKDVLSASSNTTPTRGHPGADRQPRPCELLRRDRPRRALVRRPRDDDAALAAGPPPLQRGRVHAAAWASGSPTGARSGCCRSSRSASGSLGSDDSNAESLRVRDLRDARRRGPL